ncbi:cytochrome C biosynthesis protein [Pacificimonas sp. WHA3]|uniref:Cytochrome C biosynthesis protein n=1 Tax=Pacificimonas pallii TaxID=2827236 RepID=A0ABS6SD35_9SPHN|nr:cytochrome C biosynthesis protein [Pacificimonas pallii]MBV7256328.1 cytochrome C biosynthesis protein [Pacificimonas pallii]
MSIAALALLALFVGGALMWARVPRPAIVAVLLLGGAAYSLTGAPMLPAAPHTAPEAPAGNADRREAARTALIENPGDLTAWAVFSDTLVAEGRSQEAVEGLRLAVRSLPEEPALWIQLGTALMAHADGIITPAARLAFGRASALAPQHPAPPYFLGLAYLQAGEPQRALDAWTALEAQTPPDAPWRADLERKMRGANAMLESGVFTR